MAKGKKEMLVRGYETNARKAPVMSEMVVRAGGEALKLVGLPAARVDRWLDRKLGFRKQGKRSLA